MVVVEKAEDSVSLSPGGRVLSFVVTGGEMCYVLLIAWPRA
jgi:hypothetical protein